MPHDALSERLRALRQAVQQSDRATSVGVSSGDALVASNLTTSQPELVTHKSEGQQQAEASRRDRSDDSFKGSEEAEDVIASTYCLPSESSQVVLSEASRALRIARDFQASHPRPVKPSLATDKHKNQPILLRGGSWCEDGERNNSDDSTELVNQLAEALEGESSQRSSHVAAQREQSSVTSTSSKGTSEVGDAGEMGGKQTTSRRDESPEDEVQGEVDNLLARFNALRPPRDASAGSTSLAQAQYSSDTNDIDDDDDDGKEVSALGTGNICASLEFPSVPTAVPLLPTVPRNTSPSSSSSYNRDTLAHPTLGQAHKDIPADLDLSPFRRLVGKELDVRRLEEPRASETDTVFPSLPWTSSTSLDRSKERGDAHKEQEAEVFCSICSDSPTLSCFSPEDPEDEGCMGDLYCSECWVQAHDSMDKVELRDHRTKDLQIGRKGEDAQKKSRGRGRGNGKKPVLA